MVKDCCQAALSLSLQTQCQTLHIRQLVFIRVIDMHVRLSDLLGIRPLGFTCNSHRTHCQGSSEAHGRAFIRHPILS